MPRPIDIACVKKLCGVQYMAKFLASLFTTLESLRTLTRKDTPWAWLRACEKTITGVKKQLSGSPVLAYFNPDLELTLHTRCSKDVLGLSSCRTEILSHMHLDYLPQHNKNGLRLKRRHYLSYLDYGRKVIIKNDHKPL